MQDAHRHTHTHTHARTLYILIGVKDSDTLLECSEKRNVLRLPLKEERVAECPHDVLRDIVTDVGARRSVGKCESHGFCG